MGPEQNLLIEAGAGTGKTTRLVKAILQALFIRQIPLESIVALTFTNKAAGELKERVGTALEEVLGAPSMDTLRQKPWWPTPEPALGLQDLQSLAQAASNVMDRANISTIHSFAFSLLKRFPLAAGIDPEASIDDKKLLFDALFREEWPRWLSVELGTEAPRAALWLELLAKIDLPAIEATARSLADFDIPLNHLRLSDHDLPQRLKPLHEEARALVAAHPGKFNSEKVARACEEVLGIGAHAAMDKLEHLAVETRETLKIKLGKPTKAWSEADHERLKILQKVATNVHQQGDHLVAVLTEILEPFIRHFRQRLLTEGCLTHSALLHLSHHIVKEHPLIREALKKHIGFILIDESQDTDPLQLELLVFLAEKEGQTATSLAEVRLAPGKLFVVGDPKQSIYRFRGADIAAYERIGQLLVEQGGRRETLDVNYRSQAQIIQVVNQAFTSIIQPVPEVSPPYVGVTPHHPKNPAHAVQDVSLWLAESAEEQSVEEAQATEAEHIAQWIEEAEGELSVHDHRPTEPGSPVRRPLLYRDVALIFRTYSPMDRYIEALRRRGIPFAVESERYFFTTPEVTDVLNLLRAADDPSDLRALVGYLRGALGGLTDEEILKRRQAGTLEEAEPVRWLRTITTRMGREPLAEVLATIFDNTYLIELAARSYHGDQTVANLFKLRRLLERFAEEGLTTMGLLLQKLQEFFDDDTVEGESPLADENYNAVRLLTIHKAKGLEYPVVFLPSLHSGLRAHAATPCQFDWRTQKLGLSVGGYCNLDKLHLDHQTQKREAAEQNRILYVAMTRARERLVLSGGVNLKAAHSTAYLQRLMGALGQSVETLASGEMVLKETSLSVRRLPRAQIPTETTRALPQEQPLTHLDPAAFAQRWNERAKICAAAQATPLSLAPTSKPSFPAATGGESMDPRPEPAGDDVIIPRGSATLLGTLVHRFLEQWDFAAEKCAMPAQLRQVANAFFATQGLLKEPFPDPKVGGETQNPAPLVAMVEEAQDLLADFIGSEAWQEIKDSTILGREIPFFYSVGADHRVRPPSQPQSIPIVGQAQWPAPTVQTMMRGTMDILYRLPSGQLVIGDYKTGRIKDPDALAAQATAYETAVSKTLGEKARFKPIYLRLT